MAVTQQQTLFSYTAAGGTEFGFGCRILSAADLKVTVDGVLKAAGSDFTISGVAAAAGGTVVFLVPPPSGSIVRIYRATRLIRDTDYQFAGDFRAATVNADFDRVFMAMQDLAGGATEISNVLRVPPGEVISALPSAAMRAMKLVAFDGSGNATVGTPADGDVLLPPSGTSFTLKQLGAVGDGVTDDGPAIQAACLTNSRIVVDDGTYLIASNIDCGTTTFQFNGGMFVPNSADRTVIIRGQVVAGNYQIFGQLGDVLLGGLVNPMWFGAVPYVETLTQAKINTRAARCACKSFKSSMDKIVTYAVSFAVLFPCAMFAFANGFTASVGVKVQGASASGTYFRRIFSYVDSTEPAVPLLTIGKTFLPDLSFNPNQDVGAMSNYGSPYPAAIASDIYFTDQSAAGAFAIKYPGAQARDMFFTSCANAMPFDGAGDITLSNFIFDLGLTGMSFANCQNITMTNVIVYNTNGQAIAVGSNVRDVTLNNLEIEYPVNLGIYFAEGATGIRNFRVNGFTCIQNIQYDGFQGMVVTRATDAEVIFSNGVFRNIKGPAVVNSLFAAGNDFTFNNVVWDGRSGGYNQGTTMSAFSVVSGAWSLNDCLIRDQFATSLFTFGASLYVNGLRYKNMAGNLAVFNVAGISYGGPVKSIGSIKNVVGDGLAPLLYLYNTGMFIKVQNCFDIWGPPYAYQSSLCWDIPLSAQSDLISSVVSARTNNAYAIEGRKSSEYRFERFVDVASSSSTVLTDQIAATKICGSPAVAGGYAELTQQMLFVTDATSQGKTYPNPTFARLRIPNTFAEATLQLNHIG
jgi:hypothetical protein